MILQEFPDLSWLRQQIAQRFQSRKGWLGASLSTSGWPTVVLNAKAHRINRGNIAGPVSLFMNRGGSSLVTVGNRTVRVTNDYFFMTNRQQEYTLATDEPQPTETFNIHFGECFLEQLYYTAVTQSSKLLENPLSASAPPVGFFNRLHRKDDAIKEAIRRLQKAGSSDMLLTEEILADLALHLLAIHQHDVKKMHTLPPVKAATREEVYRRLRIAVDYMYCFYYQRLSLDELAEVALLSKFHFLRLFKAAFQQTPHQFVTKLRLEKAQSLLQYSDQPIQAIAEHIGLNNASSLSRLFWQHLGCYPTEYRLAIQK